MKISIIGTGYVGLVSGVCLAAKGHDVICVDSDKEIVEKISQGETTIFEPYLEEYLKAVVDEGRFKASSDICNAVKNTEVSMIAVGTPFGKDGINLSYIQAAAAEIGRALGEKPQYHVVCVKSTVVPTTTDTFVREIIESESGKKAGEFGLVMNPEFLREGEAVTDFLHPGRIVIGAYDDRSFDTFKRVYEGYFDCPVLRVSPRTAELIKYSSNILLAMLISYSNEIAAIAESIGGIDVQEVLYGISLDKRIGPKLNGRVVSPEIIKYLKAGRGFGGSCFPKDIKAIMEFSKQFGYSPKLLEATISINEAQTTRIAERLERELESLDGKKLMILGLSFKPYTDDVRESPSLKLIRKLEDKNAIICCSDPAAVNNAKKEVPPHVGLVYVGDYRRIIKDMDAVLLMTPWDEYIKYLSEGDSPEGWNFLLYDCCGALNKNKIAMRGIKYIATGLS